LKRNYIWGYKNEYPCSTPQLFAAEEINHLGNFQRERERRRRRNIGVHCLAKQGRVREMRQASLLISIQVQKLTRVPLKPHAPEIGHATQNIST
jgi:hypothetical protein